MSVFKPSLPYDEKVSALLDTILNEERTAKCLEEIRTYDQYTYWHCVRVAILSLRLGLIRNYSNNELMLLGASALLHDYGKLMVPLEILNKPSRLTDEEYSIVKLHVLNGVTMLAELGFPKEILRTISEHHEGMKDGYPFGLEINEISRMGRIVRISDFYDALVVKRVYHKEYTIEEVMDILTENETVDMSLVKLIRSMAI